MPKNILHIAIAENAPIISAGITHTVGRLPELAVHATEISSLGDLHNCLKSDNIDILIIDPFFSDSSDIAAIRDRFPDLKLIAIASAPLDRSRREQFDETISIVDDISTIAKKIKAVAVNSEEILQNKEPLSNREKEIIVLVVKGMTNKEIADRLFLSVHTVITHRRNIARKLEIHSATGLTIYAIVNKLVDISELHL